MLDEINIGKKSPCSLQVAYKHLFEMDHGHKYEKQKYKPLLWNIRESHYDFELDKLLTKLEPKH